MTLSQFRIELRPNGASAVVVDEVDISDRVGGLSLFAHPGGPARLTVELLGEGGIEGLGEVTATRNSDLAEFFDNIDAEELERVALERVGFGNSNVTQTMLDILRDWAMGNG